MDRGLRLRHGPPSRLRRSEQGAKRRCLRSGEMERVRLWIGHGSAGYDLVRYSRSSIVRGERPSFLEAVRMSRMALSIRVSSRAAQTGSRPGRSAELTAKLGANINGGPSTTPLRPTAGGSEEIDPSVRGPSPSVRLGMTAIIA